MVAAAPLASRREVLDEAALSEVVLVGGVEFAPFVAVLARGSGFPSSTRRVPPGSWLRAPLRGQDNGSLPLVRLGTRFRAVSRRRLLGSAPTLDPGIRLGLPGVFVTTTNSRRRFQLTHKPLVGDSLAERHDDGGWRDAGDCVTYLAETLDALSQRFALALSDGEEVAANFGSGERPREVGDELLAQLPQDPMDPGGRFINHEQAVPLRATWK